MTTASRVPLAPTALRRLPIGRIRARGWLEEQLRLSAAGLTGHMMEVWPDVGPGSGWLGGAGERWERGPYYARGLTALAYTLGDRRLIERARVWLEWSLASQRADGFFGPADNDDWWPRMPMLDALRLHYEATADPRVLPFMSRYFRYQLAALPARPLEGWGKPRGGDNLALVLWLYDQTGAAFLLTLADLLHRQTSDWAGELGGERPPSDAFEFAHGVNRAMGLKEPAVYFLRSRDLRHLMALRAGWEDTLARHGQVQGTFSSDESLHGRGATQGTELCAVVESLASLECGLAISGEGWIADAIERIAYNALPAMLSPDHHGHQYFQLANQVACTPGPHRFWVHHGTNLLFGPATGYGCCAANYHLGWPGLVNHLWLTTTDGAPCAMLLGPCEVVTRVGAGSGTEVTITEETGYPFSGDVRFIVRVARSVEFPLAVRVPAWATTPTIRVNGERVETPTHLDRTAGANVDGNAGTDPDGMAGAHPDRIVLRRKWRTGDTVLVKFPMEVRVSDWTPGEAVVERGPLVFALGLGEEWRPVAGTPPWSDYEVHPTTAWNYGLAVDAEAPAGGVAVEERPPGRRPWTLDAAPVRVMVDGRRIPEWTLDSTGVSGDIPARGFSAPTPRERLTLVPFGCARLRIAVFPRLTPTGA